MTRNYTNTSVQTTLVGGIDASVTSLIVADATGYPTAPFAIVIDPDSATAEEVLLVTVKVGATFTVTRGFDGTTGKAHSAGATVIHAAIAADFVDLQSAISDHEALTTTAHGGIVSSDDARLADSRTPTGSAGGVLAGTYPDPSFAADMATQAELDTHAADTTAVHGITDTSTLVLTGDARLSDSRTPTGTAGGVLSGTYPNPGFAADMATQAELDTEASTRASADTTNAGNLTTHAALTTDAHGGIVASSDARLTDARTPTAHASTHMHGGGDQVATATATANAIPKAGVGGQLDVGWLPTDLTDAGDSTLHFHATDRARANHTGTQLSSTISDLQEFIDDRMTGLLVPGDGMIFTYNDAANTLRIDASIDLTTDVTNVLPVVLGGTGLTTRIGVRVSNSSDISITQSTVTALTFDTDLFDTNTMHSTSSNTGRLTCVTAGDYFLVVAVRFSALLSGIRYVQIRLNGSTDSASNSSISAESNTLELIAATESDTASGEMGEAIISRGVR